MAADVQYVSVIEDNTYLCWQQEVQIYNFIEMGIAKNLWVVILYQGASVNQECISSIMKLHAERVRIYRNTQPERIVSGYKALNKPWGISRLLQQEPHVGHSLFSIDSDVWFKRPVNFANMLTNDMWYGSLCSSYLSSAHWRNDKHFTKDEMNRITQIVDINAEDFSTIDDRAIGAQLLFKDVDWRFFAAVTEDAWRIHDALKEVHDNGKENQHWVAEMLSFILHIYRVKGKSGIATHTELDFAWATTTDTEQFEKFNIIHMAGVFERNGPCFCKERYISVTPWDCPRGMTYATATGSSQAYVALIQRYVTSAYFRRNSSKQM